MSDLYFKVLNDLLRIPLFTGFVFALVGFFLFTFPPKKINGLYGYRTSSSMKSQERWDFAQIYSSKEMIKIGIILMLLSLTGFLFSVGGEKNSFVGLIMMIAAVGSLFARVERGIKYKFGNQ